MMRRCGWFLLIFVIGAVFDSCEKNYPDDIPKWLKKELQTLNRMQDREDNCTWCTEVYELKDSLSGELFYFIGTPYETHFGGSIYNYDGVYACNFDGEYGGGACIANDLFYGGEYRFIWRQKWEYE